jgi:hypothetical protein
MTGCAERRLVQFARDLYQKDSDLARFILECAEISQSFPSAPGTVNAASSSEDNVGKKLQWLDPDLCPLTSDN